MKSNLTSETKTSSKSSWWLQISHKRKNWIRILFFVIYIKVCYIPTSIHTCCIFDLVSNVKNHNIILDCLKSLYYTIDFLKLCSNIIICKLLTLIHGLKKIINNKVIILKIHESTKFFINCIWFAFYDKKNN